MTCSWHYVIEPNDLARVNVTANMPDQDPCVVWFDLKTPPGNG